MAIRSMGVDIIDPMPIGKGQTKFTVIAVNYFTKWAKAKLLAQIIEWKTTRFIWKSIICQFGILQAIVTDNRKQFDHPRFRGL